ncbi:hypothetical protein [Microbacterium sp. NPDC058389]|uniref:hypothetical protein n=1 Tax=Microbacterium sp. NPDC058389 TaxID=3346475 RepID=UPI00365FEB0E
MVVPGYLKVLWNSKWLLAVGVVVAAVAAFFAGFTIVDGRVQSRAIEQYTAETTLLVSSPASDMYQAVIPGQQLVEGQTQPEEADLTSKTILYAYIISGTDMRHDVEQSVGDFADTDALTALRRTTQPGGDEAFPGRYSLPILAVVGASLDPQRAEEISETAASLFVANMEGEQENAKLPDSERVEVTVLDSPSATEVEGSNPAIPIVLTFVGVFLLFVVAAFVVAGVRGGRRRSAEASAEASVEPDGPDVDSPAAPSARTEARRGRREAAGPVTDAEADGAPAPEDDPRVGEPEPAHTA